MVPGTAKVWVLTSEFVRGREQKVLDKLRGGGDLGF